MQTLPFLLFTLALISVWIRRDPKIWGPLLAVTLLSGFFSGIVEGEGILWAIASLGLWIGYLKKPHPLLFVAFLPFAAVLLFHLASGFPPIYITPHFRMGLQEPLLLGFFPLAFLVPLAQKREEWMEALKGAMLGGAGIGLLALIAFGLHVVSFEAKLPSFFALRAWSNLFLTCIGEESFFRGFVQRELGMYLAGVKGGNLWALLISTLLFTGAHVYWSPNLEVLGFVFLASLLYGGVYLYKGRIESAILTHFLLNLVHMVFFSYHAM